jgi:putative chitinase
MASPMTAAQLKLIFKDADTAYLAEVADELNRDPAAYGLDTAQRRAHFFAQVRQECGTDLEPISENLNYKPEVLLSKFSYYKGKVAEAKQDGYLRNPTTGKIERKAAVETIANKIYSMPSLGLGNGNPASGDGWRFRGRGFIQVTGRANYTAVTQQCKKLYPAMDVDFVANPDLLAATPGAERSAVGYWTLNRLHLLADRGATGADVDRITAVVNKNTDSYADRRAHFIIAFNAFK